MRIATHCSGFPCAIALLVCLAIPGAGQRRDIEKLLISGQLKEMRWPSFADYQTYLQKLYAPTGFAPVWVADGLPTPAALAMIGVMRKAAEKGLDPEDYDASRWRARIETLQRHSNPPAEAGFDVALTVCTMRYASAVHRGRVGPDNFHQASFGEKRFDPADFLREHILGSADPNAALAALEPQFAAYRRTSQALAHYAELARLDSGEKLPVPQKTVEPGQTYAGLPRLAGLLRLLGDLPSESVMPTGSETYAPALVEAVKHFQRRHGLEDDGRLGRATIRQFNVPLEYRVRQLQLALERWRWLPDELSVPAIFVNIPDFRLRAVDENKRVALNMRVVVGRALRTQTPVFSAEMTYVVFRPYWNVPRSIVRNEILPQIERDRGYPTSKNYEVTTLDGKFVTAGPVSDDVLTALRQGKLAMQQRPGRGNSLGLVKLMFPNINNVYLHDTPARSLFTRSRRDFSHGCIRVQEPAALAAWVLRNNPGWTLERVQTAMQSGKDDVTVMLAKRVPVFIVYGTAFVYENGEVHFSDDIYGFDAQLSAALAKGYPYP